MENREPSSHHMRWRTENPVPITRDWELRTQLPSHEIENREPSSHHKRWRTENPVPITRNWEPRTQFPSHEMENREPSSHHKRWRTENPVPITRDWEPRTQFPSHEMENQEPSSNPWDGEPRTQFLSQERCFGLDQWCIFSTVNWYLNKLYCWNWTNLPLTLWIQIFFCLFSIPVYGSVALFHI